MAEYIMRRELTVGWPLPVVFDFFSKVENLEHITPPWLHFRIVTDTPVEMREGAKIAYRLRIRGIPVEWLTEIVLWKPPFEFVDVQVRGPYKLWRHTHQFFEAEGGTRIVDTVTYALPFGPLGRLVHWLQVERDLTKIFEYRKQRVEELLGWFRLRKADPIRGSSV